MYTCSSTLRVLKNVHLFIDITGLEGCTLIHRHYGSWRMYTCSSTLRVLKDVNLFIYITGLEGCTLVHRHYGLEGCTLVHLHYGSWRMYTCSSTLRVLKDVHLFIDITGLEGCTLVHRHFPARFCIVLTDPSLIIVVLSIHQLVKDWGSIIISLFGKRKTHCTSKALTQLRNAQNSKISILHKT
jgi:hypothetical protein